MEWRNIYRGFLMGVSDLIPGVSGGTIALLLGIYDRLIHAISKLFSRDWKRQLSFLIPLGIGMAVAILSLSRVIDWLFQYYPQPLRFLFLGLIIGILPNLFTQAGAREKFKFVHIVLLIVAAAFVASLAFITPDEGAIIESRTLATYGLFILSGFVASAAMILPGISGSLVLVIIGVYYTVINGIVNLHLDVIAAVGIGIIAGITLMSKLISHLLKSHHTGTFAVVIGMVVGSVFVLFEGFPQELSQLLLSVVTFAMGLAGAYLLGRVR